MPYKRYVYPALIYQASVFKSALVLPISISKLRHISLIQEYNLIFPTFMSKILYSALPPPY